MLLLSVDLPQDIEDEEVMTFFGGEEGDANETQANVIAQFARLGPADQEQARETYECAILKAEAELQKLRAAFERG